MDFDTNRYCSNTLCRCGKACGCPGDNCQCGHNKECKNCHQKCENCVCSNKCGGRSSSSDKRPASVFTSEFLNNNTESPDSPFQQRKYAKMEFYPTPEEEAMHRPKKLNSPRSPRTSTSNRPESPLQIQTNVVNSPRIDGRRRSFSHEESHDSPLRRSHADPFAQNQPNERRFVPSPRLQQEPPQESPRRDESPSQILRRHHALNRSVESHSFARAPRSATASPERRGGIKNTTLESPESPLSSPARRRRSSASQQSTMNIPVIRDEDYACTGQEDCPCPKCVARRRRAATQG